MDSLSPARKKQVDLLGDGRYFVRVRSAGGDVRRSRGEHSDDARRLFWQALKWLAPHAMDDLNQRGRTLQGSIGSAAYAALPESRWPEVQPLGAAVKAWAENYRIAAEWVEVDAISYVLDPGGSDDGAVVPRGHDHADSHRSAGQNQLIHMEFSDFDWSVGSVPRFFIEALLLGRHERAIRDALDAAEERAQAAGLGTLDKPALHRHVPRVIRRLVLDQAPCAILAAEGHPEPDEAEAQRGVRKSIREACHLLGLPTPPAGRPLLA